MKFLKLIVPLFLFVFISCGDDDTIQPTSGELSIQFNHNWNGKEIEFNELNFTNAFGQELSITKLRYLISDIVLHLPDNTSIPIDGYILVDLNESNLIAYAPNIPFNNYTGLSFTFGFDENDNLDGAYPDLNSASWNWPSMLGGGYHFMQLEGKYESSGTENPYAYHMGTARKNPGEFEQNYFDVALDGFNFTQESTINIQMNIAEWFTNPQNWDLEVYDIDLMMNYDAQKLMNVNGKSVFSLGEIN